MNNLGDIYVGEDFHIDKISGSNHSSVAIVAGTHGLIFADGQGLMATFDRISSMAFNHSNYNSLYLSDFNNDLIRKVDVTPGDTYNVTTAISIPRPSAIVLGSTTHVMFVASYDDNIIYKVDTFNWAVIATYGMPGESHSCFAVFD
jgi:hypothetical protein